MGSGKKAAGVLAVVGVAVGAAIVLSNVRTSSAVTLGASPRSGPAPLRVTLTGSYIDQAGNGIPSATMFLFANGVAVATFVTGSTGVFAGQFTFTAAENVQIFISDNQQGT